MRNLIRVCLIYLSRTNGRGGVYKEISFHALYSILVLSFQNTLHRHVFYINSYFYTTICASPRLMKLNADLNEAFLNACLYGAIQTLVTNTCVCLVHVCPCLCLSFVLSLSLPIVCVVFPSFMYCVEVFYGWQNLIK